MPLSIKIVLTGLFLITMYGVFEIEYEATRKYYPTLTRWDFVILQDKLRITPD